VTSRRPSRTSEPDSAEAAFARGSRLLTVRPRGRAELSRDLERRGFSASAIRSAVARLETDGWLQELAAAQSVVRIRAGRYGRERISRELSSRGFSAETARRALEELDAKKEAGSLARAFDRAWRQAAKLPDRERKAKVRRALLARGFAPDAISAMIHGSNEIDRGSREIP
jgi:regulatory protein